MRREERRRAAAAGAPHAEPRHPAQRHEGLHRPHLAADARGERAHARLPRRAAFAGHPRFRRPEGQVDRRCPPGHLPLAHRLRAVRHGHAGPARLLERAPRTAGEDRGAHRHQPGRGARRNRRRHGRPGPARPARLRLRRRRRGGADRVRLPGHEQERGAHRAVPGARAKGGRDASPPRAHDRPSRAALRRTRAAAAGQASRSEASARHPRRRLRRAPLAGARRARALLRGGRGELARPRPPGERSGAARRADAGGQGAARRAR